MFLNAASRVHPSVLPLVPHCLGIQLQQQGAINHASDELLSQTFRYKMVGCCKNMDCKLTFDYCFCVLINRPCNFDILKFSPKQKASS